MAGATARYGSALFGWAIRRGSLSVNPFERIPIAPTIRRDHVLSDDEIRQAWSGSDAPGAFSGIARALLLTGQRRDEVSGLLWSELDSKLTVWTLPAATAL
jgi:integrase